MENSPKRQPRKVARSISDRRMQLRESLWPEINEDRLWLRTRSVGFTTIPRTMSLIGRIIDHQSEKGFPLSSTYFVLWCWVFDEAFVEIRNQRELSFEAGFSGPRGETTWRNRMKKLEELGFILTKPGLAGDFQYVLILNPLKVIESIYADKTKDIAYNALISRMSHTGADDLDY